MEDVRHLETPSRSSASGFHCRITTRFQNGDIRPMAEEATRTSHATGLERLPACTNLDSTNNDHAVCPVLQSEPNSMLLLLLACQNSLCWEVHSLAFQPLNPNSHYFKPLSNLRLTIPYARIIL